MKKMSLGKLVVEVADFIRQRNEENQTVTRAELNRYFAAAAQSHIDMLSAAILNLLINKWLHKRADPDSTTVSYWCIQEMLSPHIRFLEAPDAPTTRKDDRPDFLAIYRASGGRSYGEKEEAETALAKEHGEGFKDPSREEATTSRDATAPVEKAPRRDAEPGRNPSKEVNWSDSAYANPATAARARATAVYDAYIGLPPDCENPQQTIAKQLGMKEFLVRRICDGFSAAQRSQGPLGNFATIKSAPSPFAVAPRPQVADIREFSVVCDTTNNPPVGESDPHNLVGRFSALPKVAQNAVLAFFAFVEAPSGTKML